MSCSGAVAVCQEVLTNVVLTVMIMTIVMLITHLLLMSMMFAYTPITAQPDLNYTAPELVVQPGCGTAASPAADIFSLGAVLYEFLTRAQLVPCGPNDVMGYRGRIGALGMVDMHAVPAALQPLLRGTVAPSPHSRPSALSFAGAQYFQVGGQQRRPTAVC